MPWLVFIEYTFASVKKSNPTLNRCYGCELLIKHNWAQNHRFKILSLEDSYVILWSESKTLPRINLSNSTVKFARSTNNRGYETLNNWNLHFHGPCGKGVWSLEVSFYHQSCCRMHFLFSWLQPLLWSQHLSHSCNKEMITAPNYTK